MIRTVLSVLPLGPHDPADPMVLEESMTNMENENKQCLTWYKARNTPKHGK